MGDVESGKWDDRNPVVVPSLAGCAAVLYYNRVGWALGHIPMEEDHQIREIAETLRDEFNNNDDIFGNSAVSMFALYDASMYETLRDVILRPLAGIHVHSANYQAYDAESFEAYDGAKLTVRYDPRGMLFTMQAMHTDDTMWHPPEDCTIASDGYVDWDDE
ncbi:hypothetical protein N7512_007134 [Penicillium capsulatum]|nr:hypothetical protein N7512_007134 [Penicillium capsulatum]